MKTYRKYTFDQIHEISRLIGTNTIEIYVILTREKNLQQVLLRALKSEVSKPCIYSN